MYPLLERKSLFFVGTLWNLQKAMIQTINDGNGSGSDPEEGCNRTVSLLLTLHLLDLGGFSIFFFFSNRARESKREAICIWEDNMYK